ncbi:MAG: RNB domain-containing ribonuclease [Treponema sp.]|jgi:exoribonuclease-2|nr:RNB domain-containing ribonuclease [Treponema sp.]
MITEKSLVVYRNRPAMVTERGEKITIVMLGETARGNRTEYRVREKDIEALHPGPVTDTQGFAAAPPAPDTATREAWELLSASDGEKTDLKELAELIYGGFTPESAWAARRLLWDGLFFTGEKDRIVCRSPEEVEAEEKKRGAKEREGRERDMFIEKLKKEKKSVLSRDDLSAGRFLQDVEALAYGKTDRSRTMKDLGLPETPEDAHRLLLETGWWTPMINPHPARFGLSSVSAKIVPEAPPPEERRDLTALPAFAIDSPWSDDPDDAVFARGNTLYVHVADPASSIAPGSPAEREGRDRGATLYLPEGVSRMLAGEALSLFALGLSGRTPSRALTFKISLDERGEITETEIFPSLVNVTRLTYGEADGILEGKPAEGEKYAAGETAREALGALRDIAGRNLARRLAAGAVNIELPETHIGIEEGAITIHRIASHKSAETVRECMLLAGEGSARWALEHSLPFPFVWQEAGDLPSNPLPGMAGFYQLRRCMRPRTLSVKPGIHRGLGLDIYTQVTSPLRRYTDLLAHLQIRALLRGECPLSADETLVRLAAGEAAAQAVQQAERASRQYWTSVYLSERPGSVWDAAALEKKGQRWLFMIPDLALETQAAVKDDIEPGDEVKLVLKSVNIPRSEGSFVSECREGSR